MATFSIRHCLLKFRIPNNECFVKKKVHDFQMKLLHQEIIESKGDRKELDKRLDESRKHLKQSLEGKNLRRLLPSIAWHTRYKSLKLKENQERNHNKKLTNLSIQQDRPLLNVGETVMILDDLKPPKYVIDVLSMGPKAPIFDHFDSKDILCELDNLIKECKNRSMSEELINEINIKTLKYINKNKKMKPNRLIKMTQKYLKNNNLIAVPFDKGVGICLMSIESYNQKLGEILKLPQFEKMTKQRTNAKEFVLKEEEDIVKCLKELLNEEQISQKAFDMLKPVGSKPPRLYGLAKVHKKDIPVRPVLSMPGSAYHKIGKFLAQFVSHVPECNINTSSKHISDKIKSVHLDEGEELISFDVVSLYTNVPVIESIEDCANLLYNPRATHGTPCFSKETFITLAKLACCNVMMLTNDGFYRQIEGLAMGAPLAPYLANAWLSKFDPVIASIINPQPKPVTSPTANITNVLLLNRNVPTGVEKGKSNVHLGDKEDVIVHNGTQCGERLFECEVLKTFRPREIETEQKPANGDQTLLSLTKGNINEGHERDHLGEKPLKGENCQKPSKYNHIEAQNNGNADDISSKSESLITKRIRYDRACKKTSSVSNQSYENVNNSLNSTASDQLNENANKRAKVENTNRCAKLYERYMDDVVTCLNKEVIELKLEQINGLHPALKFTCEREDKGHLPSLDMMLIHKGNQICSTWYTKKTDTGLVLNYHSLAPSKYKRAIIIGMIHRIYRACSDWSYISESLEKAKLILRNNQYPECFTEEIIAKTLSKIINKAEMEPEQTEKEDDILFFINYRGKVTEEYSKEIKRICANTESPSCKVPIKIIMTMRKLRSILPPLKPQIPKMLKSGVIYKLNCPVCKDSYVGETERHMITRFTEHILREGPIKSHNEKCSHQIKSEEQVEILREIPSNNKILTYEALFIKELCPEINTKDEFKSKKLNIKWLLDSLFDVRHPVA